MEHDQLLIMVINSKGLCKWCKGTEAYEPCGKMGRQGRLVSGKLPCMELQISISGYISTQNIAFPRFLNVLICIEVS